MADAVLQEIRALSQRIDRITATSVEPTTTAALVTAIKDAITAQEENMPTKLDNIVAHLNLKRSIKEAWARRGEAVEEGDKMKYELTSTIASAITAGFAASGSRKTFPKGSTKTCNRCDRRGHTTTACYAKTKADGTKLE